MQTILVVEDELPVSEIIVAILSFADYRVLVVRHGLEAVASLEAERPDLILSDVMMPVMDGKELCKWLRAHPTYRSIPVVLMSAAYTSPRLDECNHDAFIRKPFSVDELLGTVKKTINDRHAPS